MACDKDTNHTPCQKEIENEILKSKIYELVEILEQFNYYDDYLSDQDPEEGLKAEWIIYLQPDELERVKKVLSTIPAEWVEPYKIKRKELDEKANIKRCV